eukprot:Gregarina_sp_Poly_1__8801@NODE_528_length_7666_cov_26_468351_g418_i0_p4_GENE_NODE_528_length_7666_cov_26_468351_g418_i0NODE_528_length_7666_cov_26_468351_g418_i0_p4_ORF_typecomplete_len213_score1_11TRP/PF06011_12/1e12DUF4191/PF13829_6/0_22TrkH/PF02386_16/0_96TrkH/PF02386_16/11_NODE_528_length_7666_cov_26_468351_g418_i038214459
MPLSCMDFGDGVSRNKYAPSVVCDPKEPTFREWVWLSILYIFAGGIGLPLLCLVLIFAHRTRLSEPEVRQVYGFLHNGYDARRWYWESVLFARKAASFLLLLLIQQDGEIHLMTIATLSVALVFLLIHVRNRPFDRRNGGVLDRLELAALITWLASMLIVHFVSCELRYYMFSVCQGIRGRLRSFSSESSGGGSDHWRQRSVCCLFSSSLVF